jgi:transcriptional regulator with XRE-family HTH domain
MMSETAPAIEEEVRRYAGLLRQAIRAAGLSVSEVERRLGAGPKALRRIFSGHVDLKFKHVLAILRILGMSQGDFFAIAAPSKRSAPLSRPTASDFFAAFQRAGFRGDYAPAGENDPASPEEFDHMVEDAVNRVLERRRLEQPPPPEPGPAAAAAGGDDE